MVEIERRFMVKSDEWKESNPPCVNIIQGFLSIDIERVVRIRLIHDECHYDIHRKAVITVKGERVGGINPEFEYEVPYEEGEKILELCKYTIEKKRYNVYRKDFDLLWQIDVFTNLAIINSDLVIAEIELNDIKQPIPEETWLGREITNDHIYTNLNLAISSHKYNFA